MTPVKVLIVDDHDIVRRGLKNFISAEDGLEVAGEADCGRHAIDEVKRLEPDVVLLDQRMPDMTGLDVLREIRNSAPRTRVVILTGFEDEDTVVRAIRSGAVGYLLKTASSTEIMDAIRYACQSQPAMSNFATGALVHQLSDGHTPTASGSEDLTVREQEILGLMAQGLTNRAVAKKLYISEKTVKTHVSNILHKLHLRSRTQAVVRGMERGIIHKS